MSHAKPPGYIKGDWHRAIRERRRTVWAYLSEHGCATTDNIAEDLGLTKRTIHNDLAALEHMGYIAREKAGVSRSIFVGVTIPLVTS